jgi:DNA polymerase I
MELLSAWQDRIANAPAKKPCEQTYFGLKKSTQYYSGGIKYTSSSEDVRDMAEFALQRPLSHIGFDTEYKYDRTGVIIDKRNSAYDPRSIHPLLLSLAMVEPHLDGTGTIYSFVVDLRNPGILIELNRMFSLPVCFTAHYAKGDLFCLWKLDLNAPRQIWDTCMFEKALRLGRYHMKYQLPKSADVIDKIKTKNDIELEEQFSNSLVATCQRYGVKYAIESDKERLQKSFLSHDDSLPFTEEQIKYSAEDALAVAKLYPLQVARAAQEGLLNHCITIEMPWVITNAHIEWNGVRIDFNKRDQTIEVIQAHKDKMAAFILSQYGIDNIQSHDQLADFFGNAGMLHQFQRDGKITFDKDQLKKTQDLHPAIPIIRAVRRADDFISDKIMSSELIGTDGRMHPDHRQLGTDTGRQTTRWPNVLGLDRMLRPLVIPDEGFGIGEVDWSQVEVGIAGAVYHDDNLIRMFNSGDVYSAMAQHFFHKELTREDLSLSGGDFKHKHPQLRNQMKSCTLGLIYGITPVGLSQALKTTKGKAEALQSQFMEMFPQMKLALMETANFGAIRGYSTAIIGLKRYRAKSGTPTHWEHNWLTNHPVQGSAAVVFKAAGNRLDKLYQQFNTRIIIPLHDAFIFEAPLTCLAEVADLTSRVMCDTLQEYFPELLPQVEVNIKAPGCWNKDGNIDELERWIKGFEEMMDKVQQD